VKYVNPRGVEREGADIVSFKQKESVLSSKRGSRESRVSKNSKLSKTAESSILLGLPRTQFSRQELKKI